MHLLQLAKQFARIERFMAVKHRCEEIRMHILARGALLVLHLDLVACLSSHGWRLLRLLLIVEVERIDTNDWILVLCRADEHILVAVSEPGSTPVVRAEKIGVAALSCLLLGAVG